MGRIRHKRNHHGRRDISRAARTRARKLDHDQIQGNLTDEKRKEKLLNPDHLNLDQPGLGLFYCLECDRHFPSQADREVHQKSKLHKRIAKRMVEEKAYTVEESLWAAGIGVDNRQRPAQKDASSTSDAKMTTEDVSVRPQQSTEARLDQQTTQPAHSTSTTTMTTGP